MLYCAISPHSCWSHCSSCSPELFILLTQKEVVQRLVTPKSFHLLSLSAWSKKAKAAGHAKVTAGDKTMWT